MTVSSWFWKFVSHIDPRLNQRFWTAKKEPLVLSRKLFREPYLMGRTTPERHALDSTLSK
jgi:hypothetical protein